MRNFAMVRDLFEISDETCYLGLIITYIDFLVMVQSRLLIVVKY